MAIVGMFLFVLLLFFYKVICLLNDLHICLYCKVNLKDRNHKKGIANQRPGSSQHLPHCSFLKNVFLNAIQFYISTI